MDYSEKLQEYVEALAEERRKIRVFQRELPLCLQLITQAIERCKQQLSGGVETTDYFHEECSDDHTSSDAGGPVLEEFIPIKTKIDNDDVDVDDEDEKSGKKSDWLRSVQLWNQTPDPEDAPKKEEAVVVMEVKKNGGGAFRPFNREKDVYLPKDKSPTAATSSSAGTASGGSKKEEKEGQSSSSRKQRRCWSPELHRRFINALQQLGGAHVATPKQIREFMKVDGLTNDEVKSHLQKYRLHTRRPSSTIHNNGNPQAPQFVVVGGIWVQPPPEYSTMGAPAASSGEATTSNGIYAPVAAPPPPPPQQQSSTSVTQRQQQQQQHKQSKHTHCHSNSPATSSSTHTTTASPVF